MGSIGGQAQSVRSFGDYEELLAFIWLEKTALREFLNRKVTQRPVKVTTRTHERNRIFKYSSKRKQGFWTLSLDFPFL